MRQSNYIYNPRTCRYEPDKVKVKDVAVYTVTLALVSVLLLTGLLFLHSKLFTSPAEQALRLENKVIQKHHGILASELQKTEAILTGIKDLDLEVHQKLFESTFQQKQTSTQKQVLLAGATDFNAIVDLLKSKSSNLSSKSNLKNQEVANRIKFELKKYGIGRLVSLPSIQPIANPESANLVSGFGVRINPFHKGNYHHRGADFAALRGTKVVATGPGRVMEVNIGNGLEGGYGNYIKIDHGYGIVTLYAHLEEVYVTNGQKVDKWKPIGTVGITGGVTAPHVHYEIIRDGKPVDPLIYMLDDLSSTQYIELQNLASRKNQSLD